MDESWNPEPPPEIVKIQKEDLIGDTLFSKHWLCEILLKIIKQIETEETKPDEIKEISSDFEKELCDLWDMTVEKDVCLALDEYNSIQIFEGYIRKYDQVYPRAIEILIGILVNMSTMSKEICHKILNNTSLIHYLLFNVLSQMADVPTITQVIRLFDVFLTTNEIKLNFVNFLKSDLTDLLSIENDEISLNWKKLIEKFFYILDNSLNADLLDTTSQFLFDLIDSDDFLLNVFSSDSKIVDYICSAAMTRFSLDHKSKVYNSSKFTNRTPNVSQTPKVLETQISQEDIGTIDTLFNNYFLCLQTLSTSEQGAMALFSKCEIVINLFNFYLEKCLPTFNDWEVKSSHSLKACVSNESLQNFICITSVLNCLIPDKDATNVIKIDETFFRSLFTFCKYFLDYFNELSKADQINESIEQNLKIAKSNMVDLVNNLNGVKQDKIVNELINSCINLL
ncbi:unnamed protein product [Brachionus calyciflorus]|uniref:Protein SAAL1 n=1 Tax=Brachionus calyciflorus TaxID=104777 RepID=A0A813RVZ1_9BILA|nr:unnamed protein product [Brachionus calyciflorus]